MLSKIIEQEKIDHCAKWFDKAKRVVIVSHLSPDGDALGSSLGMLHVLHEMHKEVTVIVPNEYASFLSWMPAIKEVVLYNKYPDFSQQLIDAADVICCFDFNDLKRIGDLGKLVEASSARKLLVDHHLNPTDFCEIMISHPEISSTSELVFRLICRMGFYDLLSKEAAECIYTGMMTDMGSFTYNSNREDIYFIIGRLLKKGIDKDDIYRRVFNNYSENRIRLMGFMLYKKLKVYSDVHAALMTFSQEEQEQFNFIKGDAEGFVNLPLSVSGIRFSAFFREDKEQGMIKISLRSVGSFPCNQVAGTYFNGGGHLNASGGEFTGTLEEAVAQFEKALEAYTELLVAEE
ncbi:MAG: DHH family phosphoesterase [Bacteroidaceae bacterium]|nr:DHH family phosphoesterase [Bacteroidaceae bacterium]